MGDHLHLWQRIHIVTNSATDSLANMLHIVKTFDNTIVIYTEEKRTTQAIGKSAYTLQPTFRSIFFKHQLEIVSGTF